MALDVKHAEITEPVNITPVNPNETTHFVLNHLPVYITLAGGKVVRLVRDGGFIFCSTILPTYDRKQALKLEQEQRYTIGENGELTVSVSRNTKNGIPVTIKNNTPREAFQGIAGIADSVRDKTGKALARGRELRTSESSMLKWDSQGTILVTDTFGNPLGNIYKEGKYIFFENPISKDNIILRDGLQEIGLAVQGFRFFGAVNNDPFDPNLRFTTDKHFFLEVKRISDAEIYLTFICNWAKSGVRVMIE